MQSVIEYIILEKLTSKQQELVGSHVLSMFTGSKLSKDKIKDMLKSISSKDNMDSLIELTDYIQKIDKKNSFPYLSEKDDFLLQDNYERIIDNLAQYIEKYYANSGEIIS
jgi:hypothetical protein